MKKLKKAVCFLLIAVSLLSAVSCGIKNRGDKITDSETVSETEPLPDPVTLFSGEDTDYCIVMPASATEIQATLSAKLSAAASEVTGKAPKRISDNTVRYAEQKREILLGLTARDASQNALEDLGDSEYRILFVGEKVVLLASNDSLLSEATDALIASWKNADGKVQVIPQDTVKTVESALPLTDGNRLAVSVILDSDVASEVRTSVTNTFAELKEYLGVRRFSVQLDSDVPETAGSAEILIGQTDREESNVAMHSLRWPGYRITVSGNRIAIVGTDDTNLLSAVSAFCNMVRQTKDGTLKGALTYSGVHETMKNNNGADKEWLDSVPAFTAGVYYGMYSETADSLVTIYDGVTRSDYNTFLATLKTAGYTEHSSSALGENAYCRCTSAKCTVFVSYSASAGRIRVCAEKTGESDYPEPAATTESSVTPRLWQLEVDNKGSRANGGMSYVFQGENGEFFILDGGYKTETEADRIYKFLCSLIPEGQKPVIAGWFVSHLHDDHFGALLAFSEKYADKTEVRAFYYHFVNVTVETAMKKWPNAKRYGRLHTGMNFTVAGVRVDVIYTLEDLYPLIPDTLNETSTVLRVTAAGQRIMFLADMQTLASETILKEIPKSELKSDIVQVAHHGYEGATQAVYEAINAHTALWPMNIVGWQEYAKDKETNNVFKKWCNKTSGSSGPLPNYWLTHTDSIKKIFVAGFGTTEIPLPYTPEGEKIGDYDAYYEAHKEKEGS